MKTPDRKMHSQPKQVWFDYRKLHLLERVTQELIKHGITAEGSYRLYEAAINEARTIINSPDHGELQLSVTETLKSLTDGYPFKGHHLTLRTQPPPAPTSADAVGPRVPGALRRRRRGGGGEGTKRAIGEVASGLTATGSRTPADLPATSPTQSKTSSADWSWGEFAHSFPAGGRYRGCSSVQESRPVQGRERGLQVPLLEVRQL